jgi:hypothetical protein
MQTESNNNNKKMMKVDFQPKFAKKKQYYLNEKMRDGRNWPIIPDPTELAYLNWLADITDPTTDQYYESHDGETARYKVHQIIRMKLNDGSEKLYSIGQLVGYNQFKDEKTHPCYSPETHDATRFKHETEMDQKTKKLKRVTTAISGVDIAYDLPFTKDNCDTLFAKRANEHIQLIVKQQMNNEAHSINTGTLAQAYALFRDKPFDYLYDADYLTPEQKAEQRQKAELLTNSQQSTTAGSKK